MDGADRRIPDWEAVLAAIGPEFGDFLLAHRDPTRFATFAATPAVETLARRPRALPEEGTGLSEPLREVRRLVLDEGYANGAHPQYFGYFHPRPLPAAVLGDAIAALLNQSPAAWRMGPAATALECEALAWVADFVGYPPAAPGALPGVFTSGGSAANLAGLKLARDVVLGRATQETGVAGSAVRPTFYASTESHYSIARALDILGVGRAALRLVPAGPHGAVPAAAVRDQVLRDIAAGHTPACVIGLAGATATGAVDPLDALADLAAEHGMWFHVDGAAGAPFAALPETRAAFAGLARADSVTVDPHKWFFVPYGLGCLLTRDSAEAARSFRGGAHYWRIEDQIDMVFMGPEGARPWKSLGLWLALRQLGRQGYAELLLGNLAVARHLAELVRRRDGFELFAEPTVPICCFRLLPPGEGHGDAEVDAFNEDAQRTLVEGGEFYVTTCRPGERTYLRVAVSNFASRPGHVEALLDRLDDIRRR
ncbi:pyridoxal phosphate-dependent decarboxylase family protein [Dactylosporangium sp. CA-092794]|uniref:pyridoxal phosphate-dependent decarboxylase family protein n=1 Tax=Dactylosporangium sp. CA-092794 TaxID=3239929 RepID=UPI003D91E5EA